MKCDPGVDLLDKILVLTKPSDPASGIKDAIIVREQEDTLRTVPLIDEEFLTFEVRPTDIENVQEDPGCKNALYWTSPSFQTLRIAPVKALLTSGMTFHFNFSFFPFSTSSQSFLKSSWRARS